MIFPALNNPWAYISSCKVRHLRQCPVHVNIVIPIILLKFMFGHVCEALWGQLLTFLGDAISWKADLLPFKIFVPPLPQWSLSLRHGRCFGDSWKSDNKKKNNVNFFTGENFIDTEKFNFYIQMYFENQMKCHYKNITDDIYPHEKWGLL